MSVTVRWQGVDRMLSSLDKHVQTVNDAIRDFARYWSAVLESYTKEHARWTDRTANARQSLAGFINGETPSRYGADDSVSYPEADDLAKDTVVLYLAHGMNYGVALETKYAGRYAIIWDTIAAHLPQIRSMLQRVFG